MQDKERYFGAIEAAGTKMVCAVGTKKGKIKEQMMCSTGTPERTVPEMLAFFKQYEIKALGIGTFGPVQLHRKAADYGTILKSPKEGWQGFSFYDTFRKELRCPVTVDTDVNAAALGEYKLGALQGLESGMYLTIGTGIGAGIILEGRLLHGMLHPEAGHILLSRCSGDETASGCRFHANCFEGLAAGPMLSKRTGMTGKDIPKNHPVWEPESDYIAQALVNYALTLSLERIVLGGGVMEQTHLFKAIRKKFEEKMAGYLDTPQLSDLEQYIVSPALKGEQGVIGALYLAEEE